MRGVNKVMLLGNVGNDPQSYTGDVHVVNFSVATTERWKDKQGMEQERTEWHQVVAFNGIAGVVENYVRQGSKVFIEGKLQTQKFEKEGQTHYRTKVIAQNITMLGDGKTPPQKQETPKAAPNQEKFTDDEIPF